MVWQAATQSLHPFSVRFTVSVPPAANRTRDNTMPTQCMKVRAFVETQTGDIQAAFPALERFLAARAREEREAAERSPGG